MRSQIAMQTVVAGAAGGQVAAGENVEIIDLEGEELRDKRPDQSYASLETILKQQIDYCSKYIQHFQTTGDVPAVKKYS